MNQLKGRPIKKRSRLTRRSFLSAIGTAAAGAAVGGCAPPNRNNRGSAGEKVQLVYQDWRTEWFPEMAQRMLQDFHATHPNIRVFFTPDPENISEQMPLDMAAGTAPDVLAGCCDLLPAWAQQGYLLDLGPFVDADLDRATLEEWDTAQYLAFFTPDGVQFALPKYHGALGLFYNRDLFDDARVDYPDGSWSHGDYHEAMKRLTLDRDGDGRIDLWGSMMDIAWERIQVHVNGFGGRFVARTDPEHCLIGKRPALNAMEWIRARIWDDRVMASFLDVQNVETRQAFIDQRIAMVEDGSWALKDVLVNSEFRVGVAPFPAGPLRRVTLATTDGFAIYAGTRHPEAAWELVKFLVSKEYGRAMAEKSFLQPARASLVEEWIRMIRTEFPQRAREVDIASFAEGHLEGYSVTAEIFANQSQAASLAQAAWEQIFTLGQAPVSLMSQVADQIQAAQFTGG